jgi:hypothetical protein
VTECRCRSDVLSTCHACESETCNAGRRWLFQETCDCFLGFHRMSITRRMSGLSRWSMRRDVRLIPVIGALVLVFKQLGALRWTRFTVSVEG